MASSNEMEANDDCTVISLNLGITKENVMQIAEASENASAFVKKVRESLQQQTEKETKWRTEMTAIRRERVNAEQQFAQIEKQLISCNNKLEVEGKKNGNLSTDLQHAETSLSEAKKKLHDLESIKDDALANYSKVAKSNELLENEKLELLSLLDRKTQEIQGLNEEWKSMSEKLSNANTAKFKAEAKLDEIESQETSFSFRENRLKQEANLLKQQNTWLNEELIKKSEELSVLKKTKSSHILELQSNLDEKTNEVNHLKALSEQSKKKQNELEATIESYMEKLKEVRFQLVKSEEHYKLELSSQTKLAQLYKEEAEGDKNRAKEMVTAMEELQQMLKTSQEARIDLQSKIDEKEAFASKTATEMETKITNLENELKHSNELLESARQRGLAPMTSESLAEMSPAAAATSSLLKSGLTLTEIYSQYVQVSDELQKEKDDNLRLKNYMELILKEITEKAPILQQQKKDYEQVLSSNEKLTKKLESSILEHDNSIIQAEEARKESALLRRENARLESLSADLSHQVQVLLKECEETRAGRHSTLPMHSEEVTSSSQVISEHLVSFRSIQELQQQNQRLLAVIRELSEEKEKKETEETNDELKDLKNQLEVALKEVENIKLERSRQKEMVELMVRQRDSYHVLLTNKGQSPISISAQDTTLLVPSPSISDKSLVAVEQTRDALRDLQKHFEDYKYERQLAEDKLNERLDTMGMEKAKLHGENSKLKSQVEFAEERYKILQSNFEGCKKEAAIDREKAQHFHMTNVKLQAFTDSLTQELSAIKDRLSKAEVTCENLTAEKSMLRDSEVRLLQENKSLLEQQKGTNVLVTNLQKIQNQLERNEFEMRTRLETQIEGLEKELTLAKRKLETEDSHGKNLIRKLENQTQELRTQIDTEINNHRLTKNDLMSNTRQKEAMENQYKEAKVQWESAERRLHEYLTRKEQGLSTDDSEKAKKEIVTNYEMKLQEANQNLKEAQVTISGLEEQLKRTKMQEDQFKSMSLAHEEALKSLNEAANEIQTNMQTRLKETQDTNSYYQGQIQGLESRNNTLILEKSQLEKEGGRQVVELQEMLSTIRSELEEARMKARSASAGEQMAREELNEQVQLTNEWREKYEKQMELHANDMKELTATREKLQKLDVKYTEIASKATSDEERLKTYNETLEQQQKHHSLEVEKLQARCADLVNQNSNLYKELDKVLSQMPTSQNVSGRVSEGKQVEGTSEESKSMVELWEIIRFVRKEKEISDTKAEMATTESLRFQQRCEFLENKLKASMENLEDEKTQEQIDAETAAKHAEVMEKVEKLNELTQVNKVLIDEKQSSEQRTRALETKVKKAEDEVKSLKDSNRSITAIKDSLLGEKSALKNEIMRWTTKTNNLLEQYKNINPDEYKRMSDEKKLFQQQVASLKTENQRTKVQLDTLKNSSAATSEELSAIQKKQSSLNEEIESVKSESSKYQAEIQTLKKTLSEKTHEIKEKITTLNKVKRIARQYKSQHEELKKKYDELLPKTDQTEAQELSMPAGTTQETKTEGTFQDVSHYENQIKELQQQVEAQDEEVKTLKAAEEQLRAQFKEKEDKNKKVFIQVKDRIHQLTAAKDKLEAEKEELKKSNQSITEALEKLTQDKKELEIKMKALQSQYDGRLARHEKELKETRAIKESDAEESLKKLQEKNSEIEDLLQQVQQQQKQIHQLQQTKSISTVTSTEGTQPAEPASGSSANVVPPTATIKPTSTTVKPAATKTASIRPMTQSTPTPTATVLPTVTSSAQETAVVPPRGQATVVSTSSMSATVRPINSGQPSDVSEDTTSQRVPLDIPSTSRSPLDTNQPSTSTKRQREEELERPSQGLEEPVVKKIRTSEIGQGSQETSGDTEEEKWEVPELETEPSGRDTPEVVLIESGDEEEEEGQVEADRDLDEEMEDDEEEEQDDEEEEEDFEDEEKVKDKSAIDVVEVIDDDDDDDVGDVGDADSEEDVGVEDNDGKDKLVEGEEEEEEEEGDQPDQDVIRQGPSSTGEMEADEDVIHGEEEVLIPEDEQEGDQDVIQEETEVSQSGSSNDDTTIASQTSTVRQLAPVATTSSQFAQQQEDSGLVGRLVSIDRPPRSHLAPFSFPPGQSAQVPFDDVDDCTVPSTPTLFVPKRTDGFAEAISSPHIHRPFNFAPPTEGSSGIQILGLESSITEEGMRVDDTHVNLMDETEESNDGGTVVQDRNTKQGNQSVPEQTQRTPAETTSRQQSIESLESEEDFSATIISEVPSITITPAVGTDRLADESTEQNVPETGGDGTVPVGDDCGGDNVYDTTTTTGKDSSETTEQAGPSASTSQGPSSTGSGPTKIKRFIKRFAPGRGNSRGRGRGGNGRGGGASSSST